MNQPASLEALVERELYRPIGKPLSQLTVAQFEEWCAARDRTPDPPCPPHGEREEF